MIYTGDCLVILPTLEAESVDSIVTDPPAGISFMSKEWDDFRRSRNPNDVGRDSVHGRLSRTSPEYGRRERTAFVEWMTEVMRECYRVLKPGGYAVVWSIPRTCHWTGWAMEDAGFIIRDQLAHVFASGFPKGKAQLKPAREDWWLARKPGPLRPLAIDACRIGTTDEERAVIDTRSGGQTEATDWQGPGVAREVGERFTSHQAGRWPSNLLLQDPALFDEPNPYVVGSGAVAPSAGTYRNPDEPKEFGQRGSEGNGIFGEFSTNAGRDNSYANDTGGYSRFFIIPKAARADREPVLRGQLEVGESAAYDHRPSGDHAARLNRERPPVIRENSHPTVKPVDLMRHLVRLVTPAVAEDGKPGVVLDCFLGSGSTAIACEMEGFPWVGIEKEPEYVAIAEARLNGVQRGLGLDVPAPTRRSALPSDEKLAEWGKTYPRRGWMPDLKPKPEEVA